MHIRLLGTLEIEDGVRRLGPGDFGGRKPKQLLEILLTERGKVVSKDRIADLLWPEELPQDASATIDTYVSVLRRHLEPASLHARDSRYIRRIRPGYLFDTSQVEVDVDRFQALMSEGQRARNDGDLEHAGDAFAAAIDLYRGAYLEDEPQASWVLGPRERLKRAYIDLLVTAAEVATARGDFNKGLYLCERAMEHDGLSEEAHRWAMLCSYALGRQDEALRTFQLCTKRLTQELGTSCMPETEALHRRILQNVPVQQLLTDMLPSVSRLQADRLDLPFLGRRTDLAALEDAWRATEQGVLLVLVEGEAGIGKSRLVTEFVRRTALRCGQAKGTELERDLPFSGLAAALASLLSSLSKQDAERTLAAVPAVVELVPELASKVSLPAATALPPEAARIRLLDSVAAVLRSVAPLVLFLDDLQWADASTIQALGRVLQRASDSPILLLMALRPAEAAGNASVRHLVDTARSLGRLRTLRLEPLPRTALAPLLSWGVDPAELWAATGGHPLFLSERLRARAGERLDEVILSRCRAASASAQHLLEAASVFERAFRPGLLAAMLGCEEAVIVAEIEELLMRRLLIENAGELRFPHDLVRQTIYSSISAPRRETLHRQALRALEGEGAPMAELASHALAGGVWAPAVQYATAAGKQALAFYANAEAAAHFKRALSVLEAHPGLVESAQLESLLIHRARALIVLSETAEALHSLEQARASARSRGDVRAEAEATHWLGLAHWAAWMPSRALPHAQRALALAQRLDDLRLVGRAHAFLANPHGSLGHLDEALRHAARVLAIFKELGEEPPAMVLYRIGLIRHQRGEETAALKALERGEDLALAQHEQSILVFVRWVRASTLANLGRYHEAFAALAAAESAGKGEEIFARSRIPNTRGAFYADLGLWHEALERELESLDMVQSMSGLAFKEPLIQSLLNLAEDHLALGTPERAIQAVERVVQLMPGAEYGRYRYQNRLLYVRALLALAREEEAAALEAADACLADAAAYRAPKYEVRGRLIKGQALARLGNAEAAQTELIAAARLAEQLGYPAWAWRAWTAAAEVTRAPFIPKHAADAVQRLADNLDTELRERFLRAAAKARH
ncbi:MAG TPA: BTAD domain-containing putative transcriptional regulator [Ktedonobacteraceae bacterium]